MTDFSKDLPRGCTISLALRFLPPVFLVPVLLATVLIFAVGGESAFASIEGQYVSDWSGTRSTADAGGMTGNGNFDGSSGNVFTVDWEITAKTENVLHYKYTFSGDALTGGDSGISHVILDISDNAIVDGELVPGVIVNPMFTQGNSPSIAIADSQIEVGDIKYLTSAVKFELGGEADSFVYEFDSTRLPVWGNLVVKDGGGPLPRSLADSSCCNYAVNNALTLLDAGIYEDRALYEENNWVAVPNGTGYGNISPEPTSVFVWLGIAGLLFTVQRFRR